MASTLLADNGVSSGAAGLKSSADGTGTLALQTTTASGTATTAVLIDNAQNVGVGVTPSAWASANKVLSVGAYASLISNSSNGNYQLVNNLYNNGSANIYVNTNYATLYQSYQGQHQWYNAPSGTAGATATLTQAMTLNAAGTLLVNTTSAVVNSKESFGSIALDATGPAGSFKNSAGASSSAIECWNSATTGDNKFITFASDAYSIRGTITYNRAGGLTAYNVTSDYRAKTVNGPVQNALLKLSSLKPCTGRMNGAEMDIDFFVAHELQEIVPSAVTGVKDAVNEDNTPNYQMVDKSALIPLLTAAIQEQQALIQSLTDRLTALEGAAK